MRNAHDITRDFEQALCEYTGAPYAVAVTSCTMALLLAVKWHLRDRQAYMTTDGTRIYEMNVPRIIIPKRTYVSVPQAIVLAGGEVVFEDVVWEGIYQLKPLPVYDSARWLRKGLYSEWGYLGSHVCVSFHTSKILGDTQGGAILHGSPEADAWYRRARFDGRTEGVPPNKDEFSMLGYHCYMSPDVAARLLWRMGSLPAHNEPLPNDDYPDLSRWNWNEMT